jgi:hypothetical protein
MSITDKYHCEKSKGEQRAIKGFSVYQCALGHGVPPSIRSQSNTLEARTAFMGQALITSLPQL